MSAKSNNRLEFQCQDAQGSRRLVVPEAERNLFAGDPTGGVLDVEARTGTRLRDGENPLWFLRVYNNFTTNRTAGDTATFAQFCARRFPARIDIVAFGDMATVAGLAGTGAAALPIRQNVEAASGAFEPPLDVEFKERIGQGASANVWRAIERDLERAVAVKLLLPGGDCFQRTLAHAKALVRASHKNVVTVYRIAKFRHPETGEVVDGLVLELLHGKTLEQRLQEGKLSVQEARAIGGGILDGLEHIHNQQLEHGDLHEGNVMIVKDGGVKILDIVGGVPLDELSTISRETKLRRDLAGLKQMLVVLLTASDAEPIAAELLPLRRAETLSAMREAFARAAVAPPLESVAGQPSDPLREARSAPAHEPAPADIKMYEAQIAEAARRCGELCGGSPKAAKPFRETAFFPTRFIRERFPLRKLRELAQQASVDYRGLGFIFFGRKDEQTYTIDDGLETYLGGRDMLHFWQLRRSGLLYTEEMMDMQSSDAKEAILDFDQFSLLACDAVQTLLRLYVPVLADDEEVMLRFGLNFVKDLPFASARHTIAQMRELWPRCRLESLKYEAMHPIAEWKAGLTDHAVEICRFVYERFNVEDLDPWLAEARNVMGRMLTAR